MEEQNKHVQPVFNYVTVRNPKKLQRRGYVVGTITSNGILGGSGLYKSARKAVQNGLSPGFPEELSLSLSKYGKSANCLRTAEAVESFLPEAFAEFAEWLSTNRYTVTYASATKKLTEVKASPLGGLLERLWENLLYHSLSANAGETHSLIFAAIRADHFLQLLPKWDKSTEDRELQSAAQAEIILPNEVFQIPSLISPKPIQADTTATLSLERRTGLEKELQGIYAALEEIATWNEGQREISRNTYVLEDTGLGAPSEEGADADSTVKATHPVAVKKAAPQAIDLSGFSKQTRELLEQLKPQIGMSLEYLTGRLEKRAGTVTRELWEGIELSRDVVAVGGGLWGMDNGRLPPPANQTEPPPPPSSGGTQNGYEGFYFDDGKCRIKPLGVADFRRVEMELCCYKPGEVAHIENILQGEYKERSTRRLRRSEETFIQSTEREEETHRDTISTDRYEMQKEASKIVEKDTSFDLGVSVAGGYGPVSVTVNANYATATSTVESDRQAITYAKEVTQRSLQRVIERVREERISKVIEEFEENNKHALDNRGGTAHVVGLYRWVDKVYKAKVVNYGKRLMFEFMIPEPAAFHLWTMTRHGLPSDLKLKEPIDPRSVEAASIVGMAFKKHTDITTGNYALLAAQYGAVVESPPSLNCAVEKNYSRDHLNPNTPHEISHGFNDLKIPAGYEPVRADVLVGMSGYLNNGHWLTITVGNDARYIHAGNKGQLHQFNLSLQNEVEVLPVNICGRVIFYSVNVNVVCKRTPELFEAWQIKTYKAILEAYQAQRAAYDSAVAEFKAQEGVSIQGTNPGMNRQIEQQELKKGCISWLHYGQGFTSGAVWYYSPTNDWTTRSDSNDCNSPVTKYDCATISHSERVRFFEQAFDWKLMTYTFHPYFWGGKCRWRKLYQLDDVDPIFVNFLQSGMARVLVAVRPGFEKAVMHFLRTGVIWQGQDLPAINSPIYLSIVDELKDPVGVMEGEPWEVRVPSSLTVLQCGSGCVDGNGLPCGCDPVNGFGANNGAALTGKPG